LLLLLLLLLRLVLLLLLLLSLLGKRQPPLQQQALSALCLHGGLGFQQSRWQLRAAQQLDVPRAQDPETCRHCRLTQLNHMKPDNGTTPYTNVFHTTAEEHRAAATRHEDGQHMKQPWNVTWQEKHDNYDTLLRNKACNPLPPKHNRLL
jgi:hypothetical protein